MMGFCRDGWEGEPKRTINAFTFQVNITKATSVTTIVLMIVLITSFVMDAIYMLSHWVIRDFPWPLRNHSNLGLHRPCPLEISCYLGGCKTQSIQYSSMRNPHRGIVEGAKKHLVHQQDIISPLTKSYSPYSVTKLNHQDRATQTKKFDVATASAQTDAPPV